MIKRKLPAFLTRHWMLKSLSLFLGICLWYVVVGEDQVDITINVPFEIHNLPPDLVISNQFKKEIEVVVRGPRKMIQELRSQNVSRPVDLSKAKPGAVVINNNEDSIIFPKGIKVMRLQPTVITLLLDTLAHKEFAIEPLTQGVPAPGFILEGIDVEPSHLTVSGPKALLETESSLRTFLIDIDGLNQTTTLQVHLNLNKAMQELIGETVVTARLKVKETVLKKTVRGIPINVRDNTVPLITDPSTVTVEAGIPENLIRDTPELAMLFRASVSGENLEAPEERPVSVNGISVPDHAPITILSILPQKVRVFPVEQKDHPATASPAPKSMVPAPQSLNSRQHQ